MEQQVIERVREASRELVRELGFMRPTLAETDLSPSAVHAMIEIGRGQQVTAQDLCGLLRLEKSSVSRLVAKLIAQGEIAARTSRADARSKTLSLTRKGRATLATIDNFANRRVSGALAVLQERSQRHVADGLAAYARALAGREAPAAATIEAGYRSAIIGRCATMHAQYYSAAFGLGPTFERRVAGEFSEFAGRLANPLNQVWSAHLGGEIVGTIAIDGEDMGEGIAHLRWFILDDGLRGRGRRPPQHKAAKEAALAHCDAHAFSETKLWTFRGLDSARHLYETSGFRLIHEEPGSQWGSEVMEQMFARPRAGE
jgi:DNA-binding MarR family transcriptional regulator